MKYLTFFLKKETAYLKTYLGVNICNYIVLNCTYLKASTLKNAVRFHPPPPPLAISARLWILKICNFMEFTARVLMEMFIKKGRCIPFTLMRNVHYPLKCFDWPFVFFPSRSWSSPLFVLQTRTWIRPRNSHWLVSICYCSVWDSWHHCFKDRGQVSGGREWCPATETHPSSGLLQHPGTSQSPWG